MSWLYEVKLCQHGEILVEPISKAESGYCIDLEQEAYINVGLLRNKWVKSPCLLPLKMNFIQACQ